MADKPEKPRLEGVSWGGMTIPPPPTIEQAALDEQLETAARLKREAEETAAYVKENFKKLMGQDLAVEITSIQILHSHNCLIVNDLLLLSYREAKELLEQL